MRDLNALSLPELFAAVATSGTVQPLLELALAEDLADIGDVTTESIVDADATAQGRIVARRSGVVSGLPACLMLLAAAEAGEAVELEFETVDGSACACGDTVATVSGSLGFLLILERTMLNLLGRLSGVATLTRAYVEAVEGTSAVVCDTRKTTPGLRMLEKYAVRCGGGTVHRLGLYDAALYKDNHLAGIEDADLAAHLHRAIAEARGSGQLRFVEVEVDRLEQFEALLELPDGAIDIILLDNMNPDTLVRAVALRDRRAPSLLLEASGGVSLETIRSIAETGVDRISVGALTHGSTWLDLALDMDP